MFLGLLGMENQTRHLLGGPKSRKFTYEPISCPWFLGLEIMGRMSRFAHRVCHSHDGVAEEILFFNDVFVRFCLKAFIARANPS